MRALLNSSEEETPQRPNCAAPPRQAFSPSLLDTPTESSQETQASQESQDSLETLPAATPPVTNAEKTSPADSVSSSSQAREVVDVQTPNAKIEHDEYFELIQEKAPRVLVRPHTRRPRLYQHKVETLPALLLVDAVDDGVRLASPGIRWSIYDSTWEVVLTASLGWRSLKNKSRSHQVRPSTAIYAFLRKLVYVGAPIRFTHLCKVHCHNLFTKGNVEAVVDVDDVQKARKLRDEFIQEHKADTKSWKKVTTLTQPPPKAPCKRSERIQQQTSQKLTQEQFKAVHAKIKALEAAKFKANEEAKRARLNSQQRTRDLKKTIRSVVREQMDKFKTNVNRQLKNVRGTVGKHKAKTDEDFQSFQAGLEERLANVSEDVRELIEADLRARVQELADKVDELTSGLDESNELRIKSHKRTRKMLETLNARVTTTNKKMKRTNKKGKKKAKKRGTGRGSNDENREAAPPPSVAPAIVARPPTPMVSVRSDPAYPMYGTPPPSVHTRVPAVPHYATAGAQYVSPAFANRNFAR